MGSSRRARQFNLVPVFALLLHVAIGVGCNRQETSENHPDSTGTYQVLPTRTTGGTGRVYLGREIAEGLGHPSADWMERPSREAEELPNRLVASLDLKPTDTVADIGAGTGYFAFRLSPRVPRGVVYAVDIDEEMLHLIDERVAKTGLENIRTVLGTERSPQLPDSTIDLALIVDAYHEFSYPREMMDAITRALVPGGRVVLVEYRGEDPTVPVDPLHRMTEAQARKEMRAVGLDWVETKTFLPQQHVLVFAKPAR